MAQEPTSPPSGGKPKPTPPSAPKKTKSGNTWCARPDCWNLAGGAQSAHLCGPCWNAGYRVTVEKPDPTPELRRANETIRMQTMELERLNTLAIERKSQADRLEIHLKDVLVRNREAGEAAVEQGQKLRSLEGNVAAKLSKINFLTGSMKSAWEHARRLESERDQLKQRVEILDGLVSRLNDSERAELGLLMGQRDQATDTVRRYYDCLDAVVTHLRACGAPPGGAIHQAIEMIEAEVAREEFRRPGEIRPGDKIDIEGRGLTTVLRVSPAFEPPPGLSPPSGLSRMRDTIKDLQKSVEKLGVERDRARELATKRGNELIEIADQLFTSSDECSDLAFNTKARLHRRPDWDR